MTNSILARTRVVQAGASQPSRSLRVVPILGPSHRAPRYELLRKETQAGVVVTEVGQEGSVPELRVENRLGVAVFLMDGQELVGAKQNRILNTDVLVPAGATLSIPVSCVEQGRWRHVSRTFSGGRSASHRTRSAKLDRVHRSLKTSGRHDADQMAVWSEVAESISKSGAMSRTMALSDAYLKREGDFEAFRKSLSLPEKAVGVAVFQGERLQGLDIFDRHTTLAFFWASLVDSYAIDLMDEAVDPSKPETDDGQEIRSVLGRVAGGSWDSFQAAGEGREWRLEGGDLSALALVWEDRVVLHLQVFPRAEVR